MSKIVKGNLLVVVVMILIAALTRFIPHYPNFTAVGAMALFGSAYLGRNSLALIVPILAMFISDLVLNNVLYSQFNEGGFVFLAKGSLWIYGAFALVVVFGKRILQKVNTKNFLVSAFVASLIFFLVTNFSVWFTQTHNLMPRTAASLGATFVAGIPFFWNTLLGNLFFGAVLFGAYEWYLAKKTSMAYSSSGYSTRT